MTVISISPQLTPILQPQKWAQNGKLVPTHAQIEMAQGLNQVLRWRTKELFSAGEDVSTIARGGYVGSMGAVTMWRFYAHLGPSAARVRVRMLLGGCTDPSPTATCTIADSTGATIGTVTCTYAPTNVGTFASGPGYLAVLGPPSQWTEYTGTVDVTADTDIQGTFSTTNSGQIIAAVVYEESLEPTLANGYLQQSVGASSPILDSDRGLVLAKANSMWRRGGAHVLNWSVEDQSAPRTVAVNNATNIIDGAVGIFTYTTGFTLDMRYKARTSRSATGVQCYVQVRCKSSIANHGRFDIWDSGGTSIMHIDLWGTAEAWRSGAVTFPATKAKYDMTFQTDSGTATLYAVSIYEYEA